MTKGGCMGESVNNTGNSTSTDGVSGQTDTGTTNLESIMDNMAGQQPASKPSEGNTGDTDKGSTNNQGQINNQELPTWTSQLNDELKNNSDVMKQLSKFGKISDLAKSYSELEAKLGKSIVKPEKDASAEEKEAFYQALGKPTSADKYSIDVENSEAFKEMAFKNNLTDEQAKGIFQSFSEFGKNVLDQQKAQIASNAKTADETLRKEWGNNYDAKIKMLQRGVNAYGGNALGQKLKQSGLLFDVDVIKIFVKLGEENAEAGTVGRTFNGGNDYKTTAEGGKFSWIEKIK